MQQLNNIKINVTRADGARTEMLEEATQSLLNELNEHRRGVASLAPSLPTAPGTKDVFGISPEIVIASGSLVSAWIVPAVQNWLSSQSTDSGIIFTLKNANGEDYDVSIGANASPEVVAKLSGAIARLTKA